MAVDQRADRTTLQNDAERRVTLDRERTLRLDFNAMCKAEELSGRNFMDAATWRALNARDYRALAGACLVDEDPSLTLEQVGRMMTFNRESEVSAALLELYLAQAASRSGDEEETEPARPTSAGSGDGQ
jgi:hypothetical protein